MARHERNALRAGATTATTTTRHKTTGRQGGKGWERGGREGGGGGFTLNTLHDITRHYMPWRQTTKRQERGRGGEGEGGRAAREPTERMTGRFDATHPEPIIKKHDDSTATTSVSPCCMISISNGDLT